VQRDGKENQEGEILAKVNVLPAQSCLFDGSCICQSDDPDCFLVIADYCANLEHADKVCDMYQTAASAADADSVCHYDDQSESTPCAAEICDGNYDSTFCQRFAAQYCATNPQDEACDFTMFYHTGEVGVSVVLDLFSREDVDDIYLVPVTQECARANEYHGEVLIKDLTVNHYSKSVLVTLMGNYMGEYMVCREAYDSISASVLSHKFGFFTVYDHAQCIFDADGAPCTIPHCVANPQSEECVQIINEYCGNTHDDMACAFLGMTTQFESVGAPPCVHDATGSPCGSDRDIRTFCEATSWQGEYAGTDCMAILAQYCVTNTADEACNFVVKMFTRQVGVASAIEVAFDDVAGEVWYACDHCSCDDQASNSVEFVDTHAQQINVAAQWLSLEFTVTFAHNFKICVGDQHFANVVVFDSSSCLFDATEAGSPCNNPICTGAFNTECMEFVSEYCSSFGHEDSACAFFQEMVPPVVHDEGCLFDRIDMLSPCSSEVCLVGDSEACKLYTEDYCSYWPEDTGFQFCKFRQKLQSTLTMLVGTLPRSSQKLKSHVPFRFAKRWHPTPNVRNAVSTQKSTALSMTTLAVPTLQSSFKKHKLLKRLKRNAKLKKLPLTSRLSAETICIPTSA
jgi:hypothetical protein